MNPIVYRVMNLRIPYKIELAKTLSGHFYKVSTIKGKLVGVYPSATTILNAYPQNPYLTKWIADNGWQESQRIKSEAGERGTRVHKAVEILLDGGELQEQDYALEEWWKINTFAKWYADYKPEDIAGEVALFSRKGKYAGRVDRVMRINGEIYVIDWKTSSSIYPHFPLQFAAYANAIEEANPGEPIHYTATLQLGAKNKNGYRFAIYPREEWKEHYKVFQNVKKVWEYDYGDRAKDLKEEILELPVKLSIKDLLKHEVKT